MRRWLFGRFHVWEQYIVPCVYLLAVLLLFALIALTVRARQAHREPPRVGPGMHVELGGS